MTTNQSYKFAFNEENKACIFLEGWQNSSKEKEIAKHPTAGDGDITLNLTAIEAAHRYKLDRLANQNIQIHPVILSERDMSGTITIPAPFPKYEFRLVRRNSSLDKLNISIAYYACLVQFLHTSVCYLDWENYLNGETESHVDFWLLVKKIQNPKEMSWLNKACSSKQAEIGFNPLPDTTFYTVDAVAAIGSIFDLGTTHGLNQFATIENEQDLNTYPSLALKWVAKHPGCSIQNLISKSLPIWQKYCKKEVIAEAPLSKSMQILVNRGVIKSV